MRDTPRPAPTGDLDTPDEIAEMVRRFSADLAQDDLLGPMFNDVAVRAMVDPVPRELPAIAIHAGRLLTTRGSSDDV